METLQVGDIVERNMFGIKMDLRISAIDDKLIHCGPWTFDKHTGQEVDEDLSTSPSHIKPKK